MKVIITQGKESVIAEKVISYRIVQGWGDTPYHQLRMLLEGSGETGELTVCSAAFQRDTWDDEEGEWKAHPSNEKMLNALTFVKSQLDLFMVKEAPGIFWVENELLHRLRLEED